MNGKKYYLHRVEKLFPHLTAKQQTIIRGASNASFHYLGSAKMFGQIGKAFADAMAKMESEQ